MELIIITLCLSLTNRQVNSVVVLSPLVYSHHLFFFIFTDNDTDIDTETDTGVVTVLAPMIISLEMRYLRHSWRLLLYITLLWCLMSAKVPKVTVSMLFVPQLVQANYKENKLPHYWPFIGDHWVPPRRGPVMRKAFPCHDIIMSQNILCNVKPLILAWLDAP